MSKSNQVIEFVTLYEGCTYADLKESFSVSAITAALKTGKIVRTGDDIAVSPSAEIAAVETETPFDGAPLLDPAENVWSLDAAPVEVSSETPSEASESVSDEVLETSLLDMVRDETSPLETLKRDFWAVSSDDVNTMRARVQNEFDMRKTFEKENDSPCLRPEGDFKKAHAAYLTNDLTLRAMVVLGINPAFINRSVTQGKRFNLKGLLKFPRLVESLYAFSKPEKVTTSFLACFVLMSAKQDWCSNDTQRAFLSGRRFATERGYPHELCDMLAEYQHKYMTGGSPTQSSQERNLLPFIGVAARGVDADGNDALRLNKESPLVRAFADRWGLLDKLDAA